MELAIERFSDGAEHVCGWMNFQVSIPTIGIFMLEVTIVTPIGNALPFSCSQKCNVITTLSGLPFSFVTVTEAEGSLTHDKEFWRTLKTDMPIRDKGSAYSQRLLLTNSYDRVQVQFIIQMSSCVWFGFVVSVCQVFQWCLRISIGLINTMTKSNSKRNSKATGMGAEAMEMCYLLTCPTRLFQPLHFCCLGPPAVWDHLLRGSPPSVNRACPDQS